MSKIWNTIPVSKKFKFKYYNIENALDGKIKNKFRIMFSI